MVKNLSKYSALIFDLDGTLYYQKPVRLLMFLRLILYYTLRPYRIKELLVLKKYRQLRETRFGTDSPDFEEKQVLEVSKRFLILPEDVRSLLKTWLINKALFAVKIFKKRKLLRHIEEFQKLGVIVVIYSDYPVKEKLQAINFRPDYFFYSNDNLIRCMKPDPGGLLRIIDFLKLNKEFVLYVGDRDERDGLCAQLAGVDYLDVKEFEKISAVKYLN